MKNLKSLAFGICLFGASAFAISCGGGSSDGGNAHESGTEYTSAYVCPMHCKDSGAAEAGICPVCNMDYVPREEHIKNGHTH